MTAFDPRIDQRFVPQYPFVTSRGPNEADLAVDETLRQYMAEYMPLESDEEMRKRDAVLMEVEAIFKRFVRRVAIEKEKMSEEEAEDSGGELRVSGSHRLGVRDRGADIDTICIAPNFVTREHFFTILKEEFTNHPDVSDFSSIETAMVPIMAFDFQQISIDLLFARLAENIVPKNLDILNDKILSGIDEATEKSLNGPRVTDMIPKLANKAKDMNGRIVDHSAFTTAGSDSIGDNNFLTVVRCVRKWAKQKGLYGNKLGYLGGVNCNILVAMVCQLFPNACASTLLVRFFQTYSTWKWPQPVQLNKIQPNPPHLSFDQQREIWNPTERWHDLMPIITPAYPAMNSSMSVSVHSRTVMENEFAAAYEFCKNLKGHLQEEAHLGWNHLFENSDFFIRYNHYLALHIVGIVDDACSREWVGYYQSRIRNFPRFMESLPLEKPIHLFPASHKTQKSEYSICYFVGFNIDKARFNKEKELHVDTCAYKFHKQLMDKYKGEQKEGLDFFVEHHVWKKLPKEVFESFGGKDAAKALRKKKGFGRKKEEEKEEGEGEGEKDGEAETTEEEEGKKDDGVKVVGARKRVLHDYTESEGKSSKKRDIVFKEPVYAYSNLPTQKRRFIKSNEFNWVLAEK